MLALREEGMCRSSARARQRLAHVGRQRQAENSRDGSRMSADMVHEHRSSGHLRIYDGDIRSTVQGFGSHETTRARSHDHDARLAHRATLPVSTRNMVHACHLRLLTLVKAERSTE